MAEMIVGGITLIDNNAYRGVQLSLETTISLFQKISLQLRNYELNELGAYTFARRVRGGKALFTSLTGAKHLLQKRGGGCEHTPKGRIHNNSTEISLCPIKVNMTACPDALWNSCWEYFGGAGNDINDLAATEQGRALLQELLRIVYQEIGNSIAMLIEFGLHPAIDYRQENGGYTMSVEEWNDFYTQQISCGGLMTIIDGLKASGEPNYIHDIDTSDLQGCAYKGDVLQLIANMLCNASSQFKLYVSQLRGAGKYPIVHLSPELFEQAKNQIIQQGLISGSSWSMAVSGKQDARMNNVLMWDGMAIVPRYDWDLFDNYTHTKTLRALLQAPGVLGIGFDVEQLNQFGGAGLMMQTSPLLRDGGRIDMAANFELGTKVIETDFLVYASSETVFLTND